MILHKLEDSRRVLMRIEAAGGPNGDDVSTELHEEAARLRLIKNGAYTIKANRLRREMLGELAGPLEDFHAGPRANGTPVRVRVEASDCRHAGRMLGRAGVFVVVRVCGQLMAVMPDDVEEIDRSCL